MLGHKEQVRILENQLKSLGEEPNSRTKHSSSGSDSEVEYQSGQESKLKELQTSLEQEREQRHKIENELCQLKANATKINTEVCITSFHKVTEAVDNNQAHTYACILMCTLM